MSADSEVRRWLRQRGAETIPHPGGTLYGHLCRVHDRLADLGCDIDAQLAGLAHAGYGTDGFDVTLLDRADRVTLRNLIYGDYFRSLFAAWAPIASPQVIGEAQRLLGVARRQSG